MKNNFIYFLFCSLCFYSISCAPEKTASLDIFYASGLSPVMDIMSKNSLKDLNIKLHGEPSGSHVACRKVSELGRECDLMIIADSTLFKSLSSKELNFRIDFAKDEIVLAVGKRARKTDEAEKDWVSVILDKEISTGVVDENLAPTGKYTQSFLRQQGYAQAFNSKGSKKVDDAAHLAVLLKSGDIEYGFLYKTTCLQYDIRFISLDRNSIEPVFYSLSIPVKSRKFEMSVRFVKYFLNKIDLFDNYGFIRFRPRFYGSKSLFEKFSDITDYAGEF